MIKIRFLTALIVLTASVHAAKKEATDSFFKIEELSPDVALCGRQFYIPTIFGPTGMTGWLYGESLVVREVEVGSPAEGIALPNDIITAVNGQPLGENPLKTFGEQIDPSEASGTMALTVTREGRERTVAIPMRQLGAHGPDWPYDCAKSRAIHLDACDYLARIQRTDGLFDGKIYVGFALNGLTWLASEDPKYWENARRLAYAYRNVFDPENFSTTNWGWGYMGVFLAEYYLQTGDRNVFPLCEEIGRTLAKSQRPCGSWGHGSYPSPGYVQGGNLNNAGLVCWMALVLFKEAGIPVDEEALAKSTHFFSRFAQVGTVPYGDHRPEFGGGNGKNALPGVVFNILGDQAASESFARILTAYPGGRTSGHTGGFMGFVWGNVHGARNPHYPDYRRMLDQWHWLTNVSRRWDGGFLLPESVIGKIYTYRGPVLSTGGMAQVYAMPNQVLRIHGGPKSVFARQELRPELVRGIGLYQKREFDELRKVLQPTDRHSRQLLAAAGRKEQDIELTIARIEAGIESRDLGLARRLWIDTDRYTGGSIPRFGGYNWQIKIAPGAGRIEEAGKLYHRHRLLTYSSQDARDAFEKLAVDSETGVYQQLARRELATPDQASMWAYYAELMWKEDAVDWKIDPQAMAAAIRVADIPSGNWPKIAALNILYDAGVLTERLESWTPLVAASTENYPGKRLPWKMLSVENGEEPPAGWMKTEFDDRSWVTGGGPMDGNRDHAGIKCEPNCLPYIRIAFEWDGTDYQNMVVLLRLLRATKAVVYLNGTPVVWSDAMQGPRMYIKALTTVPLNTENLKLLRKGRNVLAARVSGGNGADFGLYASSGGGGLDWVARPADWVPGPKISAPDLARKSPPRVPIKSVIPPCVTGLEIDPPGQPNFDAGVMRPEILGGDKNSHIPDPLGKYPLAYRAKLMGHFDPGLRRDAAWSLMAEGEKAMPFILEALESTDKRVQRAGCDAISGGFAMNGRSTKSLREAMTTEVAGRAVPQILPLLAHEDTYVREGALLALANCGKAAAKHLDKVIKLNDDPDWWVKAGVAHVLHYVEEPEVEGMADGMLENFKKEESIFGRNRMLESLAGQGKRGVNTEEIVAALLTELEDSHGFYSGTAASVLVQIGPGAKAAKPYFEKKLEEAKAKLEAETDPDKRKQLERNLGKAESNVRAFEPRPEPKPKKPRKR